ncbi:MAG: F0F1 ATP synthase subunit A [Anaerolineales bacterium]|nr:F0F1 ATP synthase subunit A [Anaerolineales bacterium]
MMKTRRWKYGVKRWIVIGLFVLAGVLGFVGSRWFGPFKPIIPTVTLASEEIWPGAHILPAFTIGGFSFPGIPFSNTILAILVADLALILIAIFIVRPYVRGANPVPSKPYAALEMLMDYFWNLVKDSVGAKWAWRVFPIVMTIFLIILSANLTKMVPGYETIGWLKPVEGHAGVKAYPAVPFVAGFHALNAAADAEHTAGEGATYELIPFLRGAATDINFPASLAVFTVAGIFVFGVWAQKGKFFEKYFPLGRVISIPVFGAIDLVVGVLEFMLEFVKVISLTLRLFGNIFAGGLILLIIGSLTVVIVPSVLAVFELFVGAIQAYVFALLALIFIQMAMAGHGGEKDAGH